MSPPELTFRDDVSSSLFELHLDETRVSTAAYRVDDEVVTISHVETDPAYRGNGYAAQLMSAVAGSVRADGRTLRPLCPFAASYVREHPDTHDLVAF